MSKFIPLEKTDEQIRVTVLTNVVKMLVERGVYPVDSLDKRIKDVLSIQSDDYIYDIGSGVDRQGKKLTYVCKIIPHKLSALAKSYGLVEFIEANKDKHKIIVVKDINSKVLNHALSISNGLTEIFLEQFLMINLVDHVLVPKHIVLSQEEVSEVFESYVVNKMTMPKILLSDPVSKYFNVKVGDVFKIIRPSEKSGFVPSYRYVIKG